MIEELIKSHTQVIARSATTKQSDPKDRHEQSEVISLLNGDCFSRMLRARNGFAGLLRFARNDVF
jgi:hypothetical protein